MAGIAVYDRSYQFGKSWGFVLPGGLIPLHDGEFNECAPTKCVITYERSYQASNGRPGKNAERLSICHDPESYPLRSRPLLKGDGVAEIIFENGAVRKPEGKDAIHVTDLDELVVQALQEIPEIQTTLHKCINGYQPMTAVDSAIKRILQGTTRCILHALRTEQKGTTSYAVAFQHGEGYRAAPEISKIRDMIEQNRLNVRISEYTEVGYNAFRAGLVEQAIPFLEL